MQHFQFGWILKGAASLALLVFVSAAAPAALAQENTSGDASTPLVYSVENTGASYPAPTFPTFAQLPIIRPLPDPFLFVDGTRDTSFSSWERRRNEIKAAIEKYEIGPKPDCSDCTITANYVPPSAGSSTGTLTVNVTRSGKSLTLTSGIYIPQGMGSGPFPALIAMEIASFNFNGTVINFPPPPPPNYGSLPATVFQNLPIATVGYVSTQVAGYAFSSPSDHTRDPFYQLYPDLCEGICSGGSNHGEYAAWSWGVSRLIDGMEIATHQAVNPLPIDMSHLAVTGCSFAGKMALFAGAFDERIALTIAQENGGGGAPSWRVSHEIEADGSVEDIHDTNYDWFAGQMHQFTEDNGYKLPVDHHELMAMIAPRALLETGNTDFYWLSNRSNYVSARATQQIYNTFGIGDRFGFYIDGGHNHCATLPAEAPAITAFVSKFLLGNMGTNTDVEVNPYPNLDYGRWTAWWGGDPNTDPQFPTDWNSSGSVVMSVNNGLDLQINSGQPVLGGYQLAIRGGSHPAATVSLTSGNVQTDVRCPDGSSYTLRIPFPNNQSYSIPANDNSFFPGPTAYQGSVTAPACGSGTSGVLEGAYFSALGLANGVGNPPAAPGLTTTDTVDPLAVRFSCSANGESTGLRSPLIVNFQP
ncbi:MAG TPA: hypothetical protein VJV22_07100 [Acidobacteriaceae bacterium]|nr:hypothetical protein [Acidobacteriaceae bacterium]